MQNRLRPLSFAASGFCRRYRQKMHEKDKYPGFKSFRCARILLGGIETMHMIAKGQMEDSAIDQTRADRFYHLAAYAFLIISTIVTPQSLSRHYRP